MQMTEWLDYLKTNYEIVLMLTGIFLIVTGLAIFITGRFSEHENKVEGFGIKMDVKNPSLILIVLGVFLVVTPMIDGRSGAKKENHEASPGTEAAPTPPAKAPEAAQAPASGTQQPRPQSHIASPAPQKETPHTQSVPSAPSIAGVYTLETFMENGMPLPVSGAMVIDASSQGLHRFRTEFVVLQSGEEIWYEGYLKKVGEGWRLRVLRSSPPSTAWPNEVPMQLTYFEDSGLLGMRYFYGSDIGIIWHRNR
jgi:hypothetical protein